MCNPLFISDEDYETIAKARTQALKKDHKQVLSKVVTEIGEKMGHFKNMQISQQEEEEFLMEEQREKRYEQLEYTCGACGQDIDDCTCDDFDFERDQGARP